MEYKLVNQILQRKTKQVFKDRECIIKLFVKKYSKANVLNEALNYARVEEGTDLNIPKLKEVTTIDGRWAIVIDYVRGNSLAELMDKNPDKMEEYLELFVNIQLEIMNKTVLLLNNMKDKYYRKLTETEMIDEKTKKELLDKLQRLKDHSKLCHGDFVPSNVIIDKKGEYHIVDWAHVTNGNEAADCAKSYLILKMHNKDELAEKYINLFCQKAEIQKSSVQEWIPIVAATEILKTNKENHEFLKKWLNS